MPLAASANNAREVWATLRTYLQNSIRHRAARRAPTSEEAPADHKVTIDTRCQPQHQHYVCSPSFLSDSYHEGDVVWLDLVGNMPQT